MSESLADEWRPGRWSSRLDPGKSPVVYDFVTNEDLSTIHGDDKIALSRAMLVARAPTLRDTAIAAAQVFAVMKQFGRDRERGTAMDTLPLLKAALWNTADAKLRRLFGGRKQVSMFEMTRYLAKYLE
jgi:hypothetical protein